MLPFERLSSGGKLRRLRLIARRALDAYGFGEARLTPLRHATWSTTFRVDGISPPGRYVLRIHGQREADEAEARSELLWLQALRRETDLVAPEPITTPDGELVATAEMEGVPGPRCCVLLRWLDGRLLSYRAGPRTVNQVGRLMARLHGHAEAFTPPPGFRRDRLDPADLLRDWSPSALGTDMLSADQICVVAAAVERLRAEVRRCPASPTTYGLIHADLHPSNLLVHQGQVRAIDYGDCCFGPFAFDFAVWLVALADHDAPEQQARWSAFLSGYRSVRTLPPEQEAQIDMCMAWRRLQDLDWPPEMAANPNYRARARAALPGKVRALRRYAEGIPGP